MCSHTAPDLSVEPNVQARKAAADVFSGTNLVLRQFEVWMSQASNTSITPMHSENAFAPDEQQLSRGRGDACLLAPAPPGVGNAPAHDGVQNGSPSLIESERHC